MNERKKEPLIRFVGFTEAWEQRRLSEVADVRDGTHASPKYFASGHPFVTSKNVKDGFINYDDIQYISDADFEEINKRSKVDVNDVLMGMIGTIGNIALIRTEPDFAIKNVALIKDTKQIHYLYLYHFLQSKKAIKQLSDSMDGGTQKFIALGNIRNLKIDVPNEEEQGQVGRFFESLDQLITLHQRKCDLLEQTKKTYLQKLFPRDGENVPEMRFAGFGGDWEECTVDDIANRYDNLRVPVSASERISGTTPYYGANGIQDYVEGFTHEGEFILVAEDGANDLQDYPVQCVGGKVWVNNHAHVLQAKAGISDNRFIMNSLQSINIEPFLVGGGRAKLNADVMMKIVLLLPLLNEQTTIGNFFHAFDTLITYHKQKLTTLKTIKQTLLSQMFI